MKPEGDAFVLADIIGEERFYSPDLLSLKMTGEYYKKYEEKYYSTYHFESVEPSDIVVEVGSYIGVSTRIPAKRAQTVFALEPVPISRFCLKKNMESFDNVIILPYAAGTRCTTEEIALTRYMAKASLIDPSWSSRRTRQTIDKEKIEVRTIEWICEKYGINEIDFLRVEAEGYEVEVLEGIGNIKVRKMMVNCSPERSGNSPKPEVIQYLKENGYEIFVHHDGRGIYAKLEG